MIKIYFKLNKIYSLDGNTQEELSLCNGCKDEHRLERNHKKESNQDTKYE